MYVCVYVCVFQIYIFETHIHIHTHTVRLYVCVCICVSNIYIFRFRVYLIPPHALNLCISISVFAKGSHNNRARRVRAVAMGVYLRNETREHIQLLDTSFNTTRTASLLSLKAA